MLKSIDTGLSLGYGSHTGTGTAVMAPVGTINIAEVFALNIPTMLLLAAIVGSAVYALRGQPKEGEGTGQREEYEESWEAPFPREGQLKISLVTADTRIEGCEGDTLTASFSGWRRSDGFGELPRIDMTTGDDGVSFHEKRGKWGVLGWWGFRRLSGELTVRVPKQALGRLKVESVSGNVDVSTLSAAKASIQTTSGAVGLREVSLSGSLRVETISGAMDLSDARASDGQLKTASGAIRAAGLAVDSEMSAHSVSGRMELREIKADACKLESISGALDVQGARAVTLKVQTVSGKMTLERAETDNLRAGSASGSLRAALTKAANIQAQTVSGQVALEMPEGSGFAYTVETVSGGVDIGFAHTGDNRRGQVGDASRTVHVSTTSGKVRIQPAGN